jgi:hypothetical protein
MFTPGQAAHFEIQIPGDRKVRKGEVLMNVDKCMQSRRRQRSCQVQEFGIEHDDG